MANSEQIHIYPDQLHRDVGRILDEYHVTPVEYRLLMDEYIVNTDPAEDAALSQPLIDPKEVFQSAQDRENAYAEARREFIEDEIAPIAYAKEYSANELSAFDLTDYGLDSFNSSDVLDDLTALGIPVETLSAWHVVTALKSGEQLFSSIESPEEIAISLASGAYSTETGEQYTRWYSIALYALGKSLYKKFDDEQQSLYHASGVTAINGQMSVLVSRVLDRDPAVQQIVADMWDRKRGAEKSVEQLIAKKNTQEISTFQQDPSVVHPDLKNKLRASHVSLEDLMYICGGTAFSLLPPEYFEFKWFAKLMSDKIDIIAEIKSTPSFEDLAPVVEALGYTPQDNIIFSRWEEGLLQEIFHTKDFSLDISRDPVQYWKAIGKLASIPYLIRDNAEVKTYVYFAFVIVELRVIERIGAEEVMRRLDEGDYSFLKPDQVIEDVLAVQDSS